jgi:hypothetical protein
MRSEQALKERWRKRVRTCEIRRARYVGSQKLHLQALFTATDLNMLRACEWIAEPTHSQTPISCFAAQVDGSFNVVIRCFSLPGAKDALPLPVALDQGGNPEDSFKHLLLLFACM